MSEDFQSTLKIIKSRGYWKIHLYPSTMDFLPIEPINKGKEIIKNTSVQLRGWDYPHFPKQSFEHQNIYVSGDKIEAWVDYDYHKEVWRLYNTGQFLHLFSLGEDWLMESHWSSGELKKIPSGTVLSIEWSIFLITEIYYFIKNLIEAGLYKNEIILEMIIVGTKNRELTIFDPMRMPFIENYKSASKEIIFPKKIYEIKEFEINYLDLAYEQIFYLFNQFNWDNPNKSAIREDQKRLIERRL